MAAIGAVGAAGAQAISSQATQQVAQKQMTQNVAQQAQKISKFQKVMQTQATATQNVAQNQPVQQAKFQAAQEKVQARNRIQSTQKGSGMNKLISSVVKGQNKMDKIMEMATSGKKFSPQELLAMQTGMYRYTHELEMVTKIVEKTTEGVKKTMSTQV
jgi:transcription termination factor NusB